MQTNRPRAIITGVGAYYPDYILNNEELSRMVDTSDEWIMTRVGIIALGLFVCIAKKN